MKVYHLGYLGIFLALIFICIGLTESTVGIIVLFSIGLLLLFASLIIVIIGISEERRE